MATQTPKARNVLIFDDYSFIPYCICIQCVLLHMCIFLPFFSLYCVPSSPLLPSTRAVLELFGRFHADFQLDLHHVADWPLVRLSPVFGANVARIPLQLLGSHQRVTGTPLYSLQFADFANIFANIFNLICIMSLVAHWSGCIQFLVPMLNGFPDDSWVAINELQVRLTKPVYLGEWIQFFKNPETLFTIWTFPFDEFSSSKIHFNFCLHFHEISIILSIEGSE